MLIKLQIDVPPATDYVSAFTQEDCSCVRLLSVSWAMRAVPLSYRRHVRGYHPVTPEHGAVVFESLGERNLISVMVGLRSFKQICPQPLTVRYHQKSVSKRYTPDFLLRLKEVPAALARRGFGLETLIEYKPSELVNHKELEPKFCAIRRAVGIPIVLISELDLEAIAKEVRHEH